MAIKDWKKTYELENFTRYESKKLTIGIWENPNEVSVLNNKNMETIHTRTFKTKSQALKYARSYMRKH